MPRGRDEALTAKILSVAAQLAQDGGRWTMADVARGAETTRAALYRRFAHKQALLHALKARSPDPLSSQSTRERLLDVVEQALSQGDLELLATVESIAEAADISTATLYRHVQGRRGLLEAFARERTPRALMSEFDLDDAPLHEALGLVAEAVIDHARRQAPLLLARASASSAPEMKALLAELAALEAAGREPLVACFARRVALGEARGDPIALTTRFLSCCLGAALLERETASAQLAEQLTQAFLHGCLPLP